MNNIQKYRGLKNISQKDFAMQVGMTRPGLSYVEHGNSKYINPEKLQKMSEILDVSPVKLLGIDNLRYIPKNKEEADYIIGLLEKLKETL